MARYHFILCSIVISYLEAEEKILLFKFFDKLFKIMISIWSKGPVWTQPNNFKWFSEEYVSYL